MAYERDPTPMEEIVCRALCKANLLDPDSLKPVVLTRGNMTTVSEGGVPAWKMFFEDVAVMIQAMHKPTAEMFAAYMGALENPADKRQAAWHKHKMLKRWEAMIEAASPS